MHRITITIVLLLLILTSSSQNVVDSLHIALVKNYPNEDSFDSSKVDLILKIGYSLESDFPDSSIFYYNMAYNLCVEAKEDKSAAKAANWIGIVYLGQGFYDLSIEWYTRSLNHYLKLVDSENAMLIMDGKNGSAICYNNIGLVYDKLGEFEEAVRNYQECLKVREQILNDDSADKDKVMKGISNCYNNIGMIYDKQKDYNRSISYYEKSLEIRSGLNDKSGIAASCNNLGVVYHELASEVDDTAVALLKFGYAIKYYEKSLEIFEEFAASENRNEFLKGKTGISNCYNNLGMIFQEQTGFLDDLELIKEHYLKAEDYYNRSLQIKSALADTYGLCSSLSNIASLCLSKSRFEDNAGSRENLLKKSIGLADSSLVVANNLGSYSLFLHVYEVLYKAHKALGNSAEALFSHEKYMEAKDSMFSAEKSRAIEELETRYQAKKRQFEIASLKNEKTLQNEVITRQRLFLLALFLGLIAILISSVLLARLFLMKKRANLLLAKQNHEISQKNEEITSQRDEIEAQRDRLREQKDLVEEQKQEMEDSIAYASRIQNALLPDVYYPGSIICDSFIFYKPKDIVSGDFYWHATIEKSLIIAVADCTGHGVPGAFMSVLGISFLNEIVRKDKLLNTGEILNKLRSGIVEALHQQEVLSEDNHPVRNADAYVKDGMDITVCIFNSETGIMQFSGANNSICIVRKSKNVDQQVIKHSPIFTDADKSLFEIKGDKMSVSIYPDMGDFSTTDIQLFNKDVLYFYTDGYSDQFGGPKGKKLMSKPFKKILFDISGKPLPEQKESLSHELVQWMGVVECEHKGNPSFKTSGQSRLPIGQIDDITVLAAKIQLD